MKAPYFAASFGGQTSLFNLLPYVLALLAIAAFVGILFFMGLVGHLMIGPMDRAARKVKAPAQYFTVDLFGLAVLLQVATVPTAWMLQADESVWAIAMGVGAFFWIATAMIWWASIRSLSRAGVGRPLKRLVFSIIVLPLALVCIVTITVGNAILVIQIAHVLDVAIFPWMLVCALVSLNFAVAVVTFVGHRATLWVLSHPTLGQAKAAAS